MNSDNSQPDKLDLLISNLEIQKLIYAYADCIDAGNYKGIGELFREGSISSEADPKNPAQGYDAVLALYTNSTRIYEDDKTPKSKHLVNNLVVEVAPDNQTASARSSYTVLQKTDILQLQPIITGRYHDSFHKVSQEWHFLERIMIVDQLGDLSQHLLFDLKIDGKQT